MYDLVLQIAGGKELPLKQEDIPIRGHAVEARIYAEDPYEGFLPCAGQLTYFDAPQSEESIRVETGEFFIIFMINSREEGRIYNPKH